MSLLVSSPAFATTGYVFADQFGGAGNGPGEFAVGGPSGIAVRQSTGDVFVSDHLHTLGDGTTPDPRIERFDASGAFQSAFSIEAGYSSPFALAVDSAGSGSVYVAVTEGGTGGGAVLKYSPGGVFAYALDVPGSGIVINTGSSASVAVDPVSGDVFVLAADVDSGARVVAVFDGGTGAVITLIDGSSSPETGFNCPSSLAVDGASRLYVVDSCKGRVDRYSTAGVFDGVVDDGSRGTPYAVTADPISNEVFVAEFGSVGWQVTRFTAGGLAAGQSFGRPQIVGFVSLAVNHASGAVYVADYDRVAVERFMPFEGPTVVTTTGVSITTNAATLKATLNPNGSDTTYHFEYGTTTAYGKTTPEADAGLSNDEVTVSQPTGRLTPGTIYHVRVVATSNGQTFTGDDATFTTGEVPVAVVSYPTGISTSEATLAGQIDTHGINGTYTFYVESLDGSYSTTTAAQPTPGGDGMKPVTAPLTGLPAGETFRVVLSVTSNQATVSGSTVFSTPPLAKPPKRPVDLNASSCTAPMLDTYDRHPRAGDTIKLTGRDLGAGGNVLLGHQPVDGSGWSDREFSIRIPQRATGTLALAVNCGHVSNAIAIKIAASNKFTIAKIRVNGKTATLSLRLPGPGKIRTTSRHTTPKTTKIAKLGSATIKIKLTNTAANTLAKTGRLEAVVRVRFTPQGGRPATETRTLFFKRKAGPHG